MPASYERCLPPQRGGSMFFENDESPADLAAYFSTYKENQPDNVYT
ncbi:hypothetical protein SAMN05421781_0378 [Marinococcus luteus]|uniref:Uncharacterized protein n=1 Tax=Marinococcus luteus TaxID=1122204 RepID=A0A1H2QLU4_9BACI|nr:hypothetical protein [Marinococcus luteus]SDW08173.1 hypothetical protein SAMN05421781_0378 [Marinococcus luteus]